MYSVICCSLTRWPWHFWSVSPDLGHVLGQNRSILLPKCKCWIFFALLHYHCDILSPQGIPHQKNDSDCGVFVLEVTDCSPFSFKAFHLSLSSLIPPPLSPLKRRRRAFAAFSPWASLWMWITDCFICLSRAHSIAAVSPWSSRCTSVKKTCRAFARESIRSCVTIASAIDWLPVRWHAELSFLVFQEVQKACLLVQQAQSDSSAAPPTGSRWSYCQADFHLQFCKELLMWPSTDPQQMLDPQRLTSMFQISSSWPKDTEQCWFLLLHAGGVPAWTHGTALWFPVWVALVPVWPF